MIFLLGSWIFSHFACTYWVIESLTIASKLMKTYGYSCYVGIIISQFEKAMNVPNKAAVLCNICQHSPCSQALKYLLNKKNFANLQYFSLHDTERQPII